MSKGVRLYGTLGCHLCEEAQALLKSVLPSTTAIVTIDIGDDATLVEQYGRRIPVLSIGAQEFDWPFDEVALHSLHLYAPAAQTTPQADRCANGRRIWHIGSAKK